MMALIKLLYAGKFEFLLTKLLGKIKETKKAQEHKKIFILCHKNVNGAKNT